MEWVEFLKQVGDTPFKMAVLAVILHGARELAKMRKSVEKLNIGMAAVLERVSGHEKRIRNLERRK